MKNKIKIFFTILFKIIFNLLFLSILVYGIYYIVNIKTKKYASTSIFIIKNLNMQNNTSNIPTLFFPQNNDAKDAYLVSKYIRSWEMFKKLDKDFLFSEYYASKDIDYLNRLDKNSSLPFKILDQQNLLKAYNNDLIINYDDLSGTIQIEFAHKSPEIAKLVVEDIIKISNKKLNLIEKENGKKALEFFKKQVEEKRKKYIKNYQNLMYFQNSHNTLSPTEDIKKYNTILADLEANLINTKIEYQNKIKILPAASDILSGLRSKMAEIRANIKRIKAKLAGRSKGKANKTLNNYQYKFNLLKENLEFSKQLYMDALLKYEELKATISKNSKNVIVLSKPIKSDEYKYPQMVREILEYFFIIFFIYILITGIIKIIADHRL